MIRQVDFLTKTDGLFFSLPGHVTQQNTCIFHLSTQDSETTKPLKRHSSRRMLVINHLPSEFQGIKDLPNKPKKTPHITTRSPCKSCSLPSEKLWTSHGFKPRPRRLQNTIFRYHFQGHPVFSCSGPKTYPRNPQETMQLKTSRLKV